MKNKFTTTLFINGYLHFIIVVWLILSNGWCLAFASKGSILEYCPGEIFSPTCFENEVIAMQKARYGHIQLGRCIDTDLGHFGCEVDRLQYLDAECSGKQSCKVIIGDTNMGEGLQCTSSLRRYLEASYICITIQTLDACETMTVKSSINYISNGMKSQNNADCGTDVNPFKMQAKQGQKINLTLTDFKSESTDVTINQHKCPVRYGYIIDVEANSVHDICGGTERNKHVYLSEGSYLQIVFSEKNGIRYLLSFSAIGCPNFVNPDNTWSKKENDVIISVGCKANDRTWKMRCIGNNWIGIRENCLEDDVNNPPVIRKSAEKNTIFGLSQVVAMTLIICGFVVVICIAVTTILGYFCIRKEEKSSMENYPLTTLTLPLTQHTSADTTDVGRGQQKQLLVTMDTAANQPVAASLGINSNNPAQYFVLEQRAPDQLYENINDA